MGRGENVAIPSFIQGISTGGEEKQSFSMIKSQSLLLFRAFQRYERSVAQEGGQHTSQSLLLFRAFQPSYFIWSISYLLGRNPFLYSGHFNRIETPWGTERFPLESQSLPLFRAFQHGSESESRKDRRQSRNPFLYSGHFNR